MKKRLRVIAGPNGSGKTTLFQQLHTKINFYGFINADEIKLQLERDGKVLLPFKVEQQELINAIQANSFDESIKQLFLNGSILCAGEYIKFLPEAINSYSVAAFADFLRGAYLSRRINFTMETVFSHPSKLDFLANAYNLGYRVYLYFVATEYIELNVARVKQRVTEGGHDVFKEKIIQRYHRSLNNFYPALSYAYRAYFWDNTTTEMRMVAELKPDHSLDTIGFLPRWFENYILEKIRCQNNQ